MEVSTQVGGLPDQCLGRALAYDVIEDIVSLPILGGVKEEYHIELFTKVGLLFCSAEPNSRYQIGEVAKCLSDKGIETKEFAFTDTNDVASVTQSAADYSDVVYVPTDNTAASNTEAIANVLVPAGVPAICGEEGICKGCGVATLSISYYDLGVTTGKMAAKILTGEADISEMPIEFTEATPKYNASMCETLGIEPLEGYTAIEE